MLNVSSNVFGWNTGTGGLGANINIATNSASNANRLTGFISAKSTPYTLQEIRFYITSITGTPVAGNAQLLVNVTSSEQSSFGSASNNYITTNATLAVNNELVFTPNLSIPAGSTVAFCLNNLNATPASNYYSVYAVNPTLSDAGGYFNHHHENKLITGVDTNSAAVGHSANSWFAVAGLNNYGLGLFNSIVSPIINSNNTIGVQFTSPSTNINVIGATMYLSRTFPTNSIVPPRYKLTVGSNVYFTNVNNSNQIVSNTTYIEDSLTPIHLMFNTPIIIPGSSVCKLELNMLGGETTNGYTTVVQSFSSIVGTSLTGIPGMGYIAPGSGSPDNNKAIPFALVLHPHTPLSLATSALDRMVVTSFYN